MDDNVLEKINKEIKKLYTIDERLSNTLEHAGQDAETTYKPEYLDLLDDLRALQKGLYALMENHIHTILELENEVDKNG